MPAKGIDHQVEGRQEVERAGVVERRPIFNSNRRLERAACGGVRERTGIAEGACYSHHRRTDMPAWVTL